MTNRTPMHSHIDVALAPILGLLPPASKLFDRADDRYQLAAHAASLILGLPVGHLYRFPAYRVVVTSFLVECDEEGKLTTIWLARDKAMGKYKGIGGNPYGGAQNIYDILDQQWKSEIGVSLLEELGNTKPDAFAVEFFPHVKNQTYEDEALMQVYFAIPMLPGLRAKMTPDGDEIDHLHAFDVTNPALTDPDTYSWPDIDLAAGVAMLLKQNGIQPTG